MCIVPESMRVEGKTSALFRSLGEWDLHFLRSYNIQQNLIQLSTHRAKVPVSAPHPNYSRGLYAAAAATFAYQPATSTI